MDRDEAPVQDAAEFDDALSDEALDRVGGSDGACACGCTASSRN